MILSVFLCSINLHHCPKSQQAALLNRTMHELLFKDLCPGQEQMCPGSGETRSREVGTFPEASHNQTRHQQHALC